MSTKDLHGLALTAASPETARAFNHAVVGYLAYRADAPQRLRQLLAADPDFALGHILKGYFSMLSFNLASVPSAREALETARRLSAGATRREQAHVAALAHWIDGDIDATLATWEQILDEHPLDVLAFRLHHFLAFWYGRPDVMAAAGRRRLPSAGAPSLPAGPRSWPAAALPTRRWATTPLPRLRAARPSRSAPGDLWAAHGVAHVMEMQGRRDGRHRLAGRSRAPLGGRQQPQAPFVVASRAVSFRAARVRRGAGPLRPQFPQSRLAADPGPARPLHRRAERRLHAVPAGAAGRRRRQPLGRTRRQGRGAHRRLPVRVHAAALDDGADGRRPLGRRRAHDRGHARLRGGGSRHRRAAGARLRAADRRGAARPRQRRSRARLRPDAAGAGGHEPPRRQPRAAGRAGAAVPRLRRARPPHRRHRRAGRARFQPAPCAARTGASAMPMLPRDRAKHYIRQCRCSTGSPLVAVLVGAAQSDRKDTKTPV